MAEYWESRKRKEDAPFWPEHDPKPELTTADPMPDIPIPLAVRKLKLHASECGWEIRVGYSRGYTRSTKVGSFTLREYFGVWSNPHPETGWRFQANYRRVIEAKTWEWEPVSIWNPVHSIVGTSLANQTELKEFLSVRGSVDRVWFKRIAQRVADQIERNREAAKSRTKTKVGVG